MPEQRTTGAKSPGSQLVPPQDISVTTPPSFVSILVPCCGMIEYTKLCVPSVLRYTRPPFELIFLDIGSLDGTAEYLAGVKAASQCHIEIVRSPSDLGISDAVREAIQQARGEYIVLLNNDTIVTEGWVNNLINLSGLSPTFGLVGPMSNYAAEPQRVDMVPYRIKPKRAKPAGKSGAGEALVDVSAVHAFSREFRDSHKGKWTEVEALGGFCLLIKRALLDRIGLPNLDKWTDLSLFDTDILSVKTRQVGMKAVCCRDLFVHHFGTRTFTSGAKAIESSPSARN